MSRIKRREPDPGTWLLDKIDIRIHSKLKRLVSQGILVETEPGSFAQPRP